MSDSKKKSNPFQQHANAKELIRKLKHEFFQFQSKNEFDSEFFSKLNVDKLLREKGHSKNYQQVMMKYVQNMHSASKLRHDIIKFERIH